MYSREALLKDEEEDEGKRAHFEPSTTTSLLHSERMLEWINVIQTHKGVIIFQVDLDS